MKLQFLLKSEMLLNTTIGSRIIADAIIYDEALQEVYVFTKNKAHRYEATNLCFFPVSSDKCEDIENADFKGLTYDITDCTAKALIDGRLSLEEVQANSHLLSMS